VNASQPEPFTPGIQSVPASGTFAIAAASRGDFAVEFDHALALSDVRAVVGATGTQVDRE
jgi:hypothetical protein